MRDSFLALSVAAWLVRVVSAQEVTPPDKSAPRGDLYQGRLRDHSAAAQNVDKRRDAFTIEIKVLEGRRLPQEVPADAKSPMTAPAHTKNNYDFPGRVALPLSAPVPHTSATNITERTHTADEVADPWDDALKEPGVTVLAAPKLAVVARHSAVVQLQSQQIFTYLEPLGEGTFKAKHTDPMELGMKFVLGVQPIEADERFVELSPLEIQLAVLDGREPVDGLDLDVGKPIVATRSLKTTAKMKLGVTRIIPIPSGPKTQAALLLRINRIDPADLRPAPPRSATSPDPDESSP
jgi:hypothetical protein